MILDVVLPHAVLGDIQAVALAFLQRRLVIGKDAIHAVAFGEVHVAVRQPGECAFADDVVVRTEAATAAHDIEGIAILAILSVAVGGAIQRVPGVGVIASERVPDFVIQHVHAIPGDPDAGAATPGDAFQPWPLVHTHDDAVILAWVITCRLGCGTRVVVNEAETVHFGIFGFIPSDSARQGQNRSHGGGLRQLAIRVLKIKTGVVAHVRIGLLLRVWLGHLVRIGDSDVKTAQVANGTR